MNSNSNSFINESRRSSSSSSGHLERMLFTRKRKRKMADSSQKSQAAARRATLAAHRRQKCRRKSKMVGKETGNESSKTSKLASSTISTTNTPATGSLRMVIALIILSIVAVAVSQHESQVVGQGGSGTKKLITKNNNSIIVGGLSEINNNIDRERTTEAGRSNQLRKTKTTTSSSSSYRRHHEMTNVANNQTKEYPIITRRLNNDNSKEAASISSFPIKREKRWLHNNDQNNNINNKRSIISNGNGNGNGNGSGRQSSRAGKLTTRGADSITRIVAVSGQWIELQCPLASELLAIENSDQSASRSAGSSKQSKQERSIVWLKNGAVLNQLSPRQKVNSLNGSLTIVSAQPKLDEASYECALVNKNNDEADGRSDHNSDNNNNQPPIEAIAKVKSHKFDLKLIIPPRLAPFEFPQAAQVGMKVVLTCSALEGQQPISFVWLKDNQIIKASAGQEASTLSGGSSVGNSLGRLHQQQLTDKYSLSAAAATQPTASEEPMTTTTNGKPATDNNIISSELLPLYSDSNIKIRQSDDYSILSIEQLELKHSGKYTCSAQNEASRTSHSSQLVINAPPTLTIEPKDGDLVSGQSSVIDCAASGQPRPTISWLRARESANKVWDYLPVYDNLRYTTLQNGSLLISNVTQREQGYYLCSAKNGFGPEVTKLIKINVHEPARFSSKYKTVEVRIEERAIMLCVASGEPPIKIEWFNRDGKLIEKNDKKFIIDDEPYDNNEELVKSSSGTNQQTIGSEQSLPDKNSSVSRLILAKSGRSDSGHYICQASNKYGTDKMATNLLVQDVPDKVSELKVTNTTATTISLRWQPAFNGNSPITSYLVQYQSDDPLDDLLSNSRSATGQIGQQTQNQNQVPLKLDSLSSMLMLEQQQQQQQQQTSATTSSLKAALDALSIVSNPDEAIDRTLVELTIEKQNATFIIIKDLTPYCVYRLRLACINKVGLGEFSDWIRVKTEEAPPSGSALKISSSATGPNSIKLTWSPPDRRSWNGQLIGFNIGYRPIDSSFELNKTIEWSPPSLQSVIMLSGANANANSNNNNSSSDQQIFATTTTTPPLNGTTSASKQTLLENKNSANKTSAVDPKYLLFRQHLKQLLALQQQELVAHLTNLQRSTTYLVWLQAINNRGLGPQSHAISIKTLDDVPPSAPALKIQSTSTNSITISWSLLSNFVSSANQYSLFYRRVPQQQQNSPSSISNRQHHSSMDYSSNNNSQQAVDMLAHQQHQQQLEPGPFIERTISSQMLLVNGNGNVFETSSTSFDQLDQQKLMNNLENQFDSSVVKPTFFNQQQQQQQHQHYQQFVYTLDQLECGSVYELYMTTRNSVGKSEPSPIVTTRTLGEPPQAPLNKNNLFSRIGSNDVALNLAAWSTGGCPLTHITVRYKQAPALPVAAAATTPNTTIYHNSSNSQALHHQHLTTTSTTSLPITTSVSSSILASVNSQSALLSQQRQSNSYPVGTLNPTSLKLSSAASIVEPVYSIKNLAPSTCYDLELVAYNSAGFTSAQYEFVTSNINGTRGGSYINRKESVYRLDQRGLILDEDDSSLGQNNHLIEQQQHSSINVNNNNSWHLLFLVLLCGVCFIIISTLFYRYYENSQNKNGDDDNQSRGRRRRCSTDTTTTTGGARLHCLQHPAGAAGIMLNGSPNSIGKSSMWRINNQFNEQTPPPQQQQAQQSSTVKANNVHNHYNQEESPTTTVHYCMRGGDLTQLADRAQQHQYSVEAKGNQFIAQSVSMKDFNLISPQASGQSATLNFKNYRNPTVRPVDQHGNPSMPQGVSKNFNAATLRGRMLNMLTNNDNNNNLYNPPNFNNNNNVLDNNNHVLVAGQPQQQQANHEQETSWTNYEAAAASGKLAPNNQTTYAIPSAYGTTAAPGRICAEQQQISDIYNNNNGQQQLYLQQRNLLEQQEQNINNNYGQAANGSIEACIQQLVEQQQQYEQQQHYAMVANKEQTNAAPACIYSNENGMSMQCSNNHHHHHHHLNNNNLSSQLQQLAVAQQQISKLNCNAAVVGHQSASVIDSSSSSSGIDIGNHIDCASTTTGTSNSNGISNCSTTNGYHLVQPAPEQQQLNSSLQEQQYEHAAH